MMNNIGLDEYLMPTNSPISDNQEMVVGGYSFDGLYERNTVGNSKISFIAADKIATGTLVAGINVGQGTSGYVLIDGPNNRIVVNDGTTNRIVIGSI